MATKLDSLVSKARPSSFDSLITKANIEDYRTRDSSSSSLVSFETHAQPEEEDPTDKSAKVEGGCGREGKRRTLQHYLTYVPDKARVEAEGEGRYPCTHDLRR
jgi:hypothetical protein